MMMKRPQNRAKCLILRTKAQQLIQSISGFLLVLPNFHSFDGRISPEETLVKRRMHKSEHLKGILIILFNINLLSIQNILLSTVPVSL